MANAQAQAHAGPSSGSRGRMEKLAEAEEDDGAGATADVPNRRSYEAGIRERALEKQKARIVSQMAQAPPGGAAAVEKISPRKALAPTRTIPQSTDLAGRGHANEVVPIKPKDGSRRLGLFETFSRVLDRALELSQTPEGFRSPRTFLITTNSTWKLIADVPPDPAPPKVFVVSWLDYCAKYGMGFAMADGTVTVHFNDSSSIVLAPGKQ